MNFIELFFIKINFWNSKIRNLISLSNYKFLFAFILILTLFDVAPAQTNVELQKVYRNLNYKTVNGWRGFLDLYLPSESSEKTPLVIMFHGGGWNHGKKEDIEKGAASYLKIGFAVANVEYRLLNIAPAPAAVEDVRCALLWLVKNADKYKLDPQKIITTGSSAGGHLALMTGLLPPGNQFDKDCEKVNSYKIVAIINKYGVTDLTEALNRTHWLDGVSNKNQLAKEVSPLTYLNKNVPPIITIHGDSDPTVPYQQAVTLHQILDSLGVKNILYTVQGGKHGKFDKEYNTEFSRLVKKFLIDLNILKKNSSGMNNE